MGRVRYAVAIKHRVCPKRGTVLLGYTVGRRSHPATAPVS
jgi:hypothetical protein